MPTLIDSIVDLIQKRPLIRTVEIADIVDCEPDRVEAALSGHIARGEVIVTPVIAPNGRTVNGYEFKAPAAQVAIPRLIEATEPPAASKVDAAIRYIKANGTATGPDLRRIMGLTDKQAPAAFLAGALRDGRLRKVGANFGLGAGVTTPESLSARVPAATSAPSQRRRYARHPKPASAPPPAEAPFRCAIWSDGVMELRRGAETFATLTAAELVVVVKEAAVRGAQS